MAEHKFVAGDRVKLLPASSSNVRPGIYTIVRVMPVTNRGYQYRVKSALNTHERVLDEMELLTA